MGGLNAGGDREVGSETLPHPDVTAMVDSNTVLVIAKVSGEAANSIGTTASLSSGDWAAPTLTGGLGFVSTVEKRD